MTSSPRTDVARSDAAVRIWREGPVLVLSMNNPETRNALSPELYDSLNSALEEAAEDDSVRAIVLTGESGHFCAGGNLRALATRHLETPLQRKGNLAQLNATVRALRYCPKPVVAAVEGAAAGAGVSLAVACDMVVAARDSRFSVTYVKIGLTPDGGITSFLAESLSRSALAELCLTGNVVSGERMHHLGVVNRVSEPGGALAGAVELARQLADGPPLAMARIKQLCNTAKRNSLDEQMELEASHMVAAQGGTEAREGITAFIEKRKPNWR